MWDFVMDKSGAGAGFLRELRFPLPIYIPSASPQSSSLSPEAGTIKKNKKKNVVLSPKYSYNGSCSESEMGVHVTFRNIQYFTSRIFNTRSAKFELQQVFPVRINCMPSEKNTNRHVYLSCFLALDGV
jgi:hypothetical protein